MKWFTREWVNGELSESEWEETIPNYAAHLKSINDKLRSGVDALASEVNLHDGQVQAWSFEPDGSFRLKVLVGDLQVGYEIVDLRYLNATVAPPGAELVALGVLDQRTELLYDEIDVLADGTFTQSIIAWPSGEFEIAFDGVEIQRSTEDATARR